MNPVKYVTFTSISYKHHYGRLIFDSNQYLLADDLLSTNVTQLSIVKSASDETGQWRCELQMLFKGTKNRDLE